MNPPARETLSEADHEVRRVTVAGQDLQIYTVFQSLLNDLLRDLKSARRRVWAECYIILPDAGGKAFFEALRERAAAGVQVRLMYDAFGSQNVPSSYFDELRAAGVEVHAFHTLGYALTRGVRLFQTLNRRNHRKLIVIDDSAAYFGGMNIVDQASAEKNPNSDLPASAGWRDVHIRLAGDRMADLAESFDRSWRHAHRRRIRRRPRAYRRALLATGDESIRFFDSGPGLAFSRAARVFRRLFDAAERSVLMSMAYLLPPFLVQHSLLTARRRGVEVTAIVPGESDVKLVQWATQHLYFDWLKHGIRIFERQRRMLHSKVVVVDKQWSVIGSCNLDSRSLLINLELLAVIRSHNFAAAMAEICQHEIAHSHPITEVVCANYRWYERLRARLALTLRRWL